MNMFTKRGRIGLGIAVALALVVAPAVAANAAIVPTVGSAHPVYLLSDETGAQIPAGTSLRWNASALASPETSDEDYNSNYVAPAGTVSARAFLSPRTQETTISAWNAYKSLGSSSTLQLANLQPNSLVSSGTGTPSGTNTVANTGGDYSLGFAFLDNNNAIIEVNFTYITVVANAVAAQATWTFATPAAVDPNVVVTTQPTNKSVNVGATATFSAAATGSTSVKWQSSANGTTWDDIAGATNVSYTTGSLTVADSGKKYRAVFANATKSAETNAATLTVIDTTPVEPTAVADAATKVTIANPSEGDTTVTVAAGAGHSGQTLQAWGWSTPTNLGQVTTDATTGDAIVDISSLAPGTHTIALTLPNDATVIAWGTVEIPAPTYPDQAENVDLTATVTASDLWALNAEKTAVEFGEVARGTDKTAALGKVTVLDDRKVLKGWDLTASASDFTNGTQTIPASALTITPDVFAGYVPPTGITKGTNGANFASSAVNVSTGTTGALFDASLKFAAPANAAAGIYHSTLTLTLTSK